ncbi:MAG: PAS domain S-box protein [Nanoarchaeota archaeon]|nr:PAS domain S-box protein [Nanoarchaeota archaeon]
MPDQKFREILDRLPEGVSVIDKDMRILWVNKALRDKGFDIEGCKGRHCHIVYKQNNEVCKGCPAVEVFRTGKEVRVTEKGADGKEYEVTALPVKESGEVARVIEIVRESQKEDIEERAARLSNVKCQSFIENAEDIIFMMNKECRVVSLNQKAAHSLGRNAEEIMGKTMHELFPPKIAERQCANVLKVFRTGESSSYIRVSEMCRKVAWLNTSLNPVKDIHGNIEAVLGISRDITEQKRAEESLKESEEKLRIATENITEAFFAKDINRKYMIINTAAARMVGLPAAKIIGKTAEQIFSKKDAKTIRKVDEMNLSGQKIDRVETVFFRGQERFLHTIQNPLKDRDGKIIGIVGTVTDITEERKAEQALMAEKQWSETLLQSAPSIMICLGEKSKILLFNKAAEKITGYNAEDVMGKSWIDLFIPKKQRKELYGVWEKIVKGKLTLHNYENPIITKKGEEKLIYWNNTFLSQNHKFRMVFSIGQDVTEKRWAEKALKASENRYRRLFESAKDAILIVDVDSGQIVDANPFVQDLLGYSHKEFLGKKLWEIGFLKDIVANKKNFRELQKKKYIHYEDLPLETKSGKEIHVEFVSNVYPINGKSVIQCNIRDITERHAAEKALMQSEQKYRSFVENFQGIAYNAYTNGIPIFFHGAVKRITGYTEKDFKKGKPRWDQIILKEDFKKIQKSWKDLATKPDYSTSREYRILTKDKKIRWIHELIRNTCDESGKLKLLQGTLYDITDQKRADEKIKESRNMLRLVFDTIPVRVFWKDRNLNYLGCNKLFAKDAGVKEPKDLIGKDDYQMGWKEQADIYRADDRAVISTGKEKLNYEEPQTTPSGEKIWLRTSKRPLKDPKGDIIGMLGVYEDITEKKKAEQALKESEERYRNIFSSANDIIFLINKKGVIIDANKRLKEIAGYSREEILGKSISQLRKIMPLSSIATLLKNFMKRIVGIDMPPYEVQLRTKSGELRDFEINAVALRSGKNITGDLAILRDTTERNRSRIDLQKAYESLKEVDKLKSSIIRDTTHEFKNPISKIKMISSLMNEELAKTKPDKKRVSYYLDIIRINSDRFLKEITNVLQLSRLQSMEHLEKEKIDICSIGHSVLDELNLDIKSKGLKLRLNVSKRNYLIGNKEFIRSLIRNLVENAIKFTDKGYIDITCKTAGKDLIISVADTGKGISKKNISTLFQPFTQADPSMSGVGIGLSICKKIVELHNGKIDVESKLGKGTKFTVTLPIKG